MLTSCPKCHFSQPKDQYCAQCGIDMSAYRPPEKSFFQRLSENLFVQLGLVILVGLIAVMMVTQNQKQSFWTRVEFLRGFSSTQVSQERDSNLSSFAEPNQEDSEQDLIESQIVAEKSAKLMTTTTSEKKGAKVAPSAQIYYLEIPQNILNKLLDDGLLTRVETSYEITIGYIPQLSRILEQYKSQIKVLKQDSYPYSINQLYTAKFQGRPEDKNPEPSANPAGRNLAIASAQPSGFPQQPGPGLSAQPSGGQPPGSSSAGFGAQPPGVASSGAVPQSQTTGIITYATLDDDRNDTLAGQLEVSVNGQASYPAQFEMTPDQSFFISGFDRSAAAEKMGSSEILVVLKIDK